MAATFEQGLQAKLDDGTIKGAAAKQVKRVLSIDNPKRKARVLERMERHARAHMGVGDSKSVNWTAGEIDWPALIAMLMKIITMILALFP